MARPQTFADRIAGDRSGASAGRSIALASVTYFAVMLALTWVFQPLREFAVGLGIDPLLASASQAVASLFALMPVAGWVVDTFGVSRLGPRLLVGLAAATLLITADVLGEIFLFRVSPLAFMQSFAGPIGLVLGVALAMAALLPAMRNIRRSR